MKIGLIKVDSNFPNIALMKISSFHKQMFDSVKWHDPLFDSPDMVYASKIFTTSPDYDGGFPDCKIKRGGTGYDVSSKLLDVIENCEPDYSIYPTCDYSLQFFSRGCIRNCPFCIVHQKEGEIYPVDPMAPNPNGKHIEILDNNFFANPNWRDAVSYLKQTGQKVNLHGVDIRIITDEQAIALKEMRHLKQIHIAWDNPMDDLSLKFKVLLKYVKAYNVMCYVLVGFWSTPEEDMYRIRKLDELGISPFVMAWDKSEEYQHRLARWCNHKAIFKSVKFENYI